MHGLASPLFLSHGEWMQWIFTLLEGMSAGLRLQESPLYRYPYRNANEAFRGDAKRISADIAASMESSYEQ